MTSAMLDNPDKDGIYPTTRFYERLEEYARSLILQAREEGKRENQLYAQESHERGYKSGYLQAIEDMEAVVERGEFRVVSYEAVDVEKSGTYYRKEDVTAHLQALKEKKPTNPT